MPRGHSCVLYFEAAFDPSPGRLLNAVHTVLWRQGWKVARLKGGWGVSRPMLQRFHKMHRSGGLAHRPLYRSR